MGKLICSLFLCVVTYFPSFAACETTVHIITQTSRGYSYGTGVIVYAGNEGVYIVTAKHVVDDSVDVRAAVFEDGDLAGHIEHLGVFPHPTYDAALLYTPKTSFDLKMAPIRAYGPVNGEPVVAEGRLAGGNLADGSLAPMQGHPVSRKLRAVVLGDISTDRAFGLSKNAWPGHSGGPVYDLEGQVLGIVVHRSFSSDQSECVGLGPMREIVYGERKYSDPQPINGIKIVTCVCACGDKCKCSPCRCPVKWVPAPKDGVATHRHEYNAAGVCPKCPPRSQPQAPPQRYSPAPPPAPAPAPIPVAKGDGSVSVTTILAGIGGAALGLGGLYAFLRFVFPWLFAQVLVGIVKHRPLTQALMEMNRTVPDWDRRTVLDELLPTLKNVKVALDELNKEGETKP